MLLGQAELSIHWIRPVALYLPIHVPQARAQRLGMMASLPLRLASALYTQTLCEISTKTLLKNVQPGRASTEAGEALVSRVTLKHGAVALVRCKLALLQVILSGSACTAQAKATELSVQLGSYGKRKTAQQRSPCPGRTVFRALKLMLGLGGSSSTVAIARINAGGEVPQAAECTACHHTHTHTHTHTQNTQ
jgi:hypothetical protein